MHLLLGNLYMENNDYEGAIQSFERARVQIRQHGDGPLCVISLVSSPVVVLLNAETISGLDRCLDGSSMILTPQFNSAVAKPYMPSAA